MLYASEPVGQSHWMIGQSRPNLQNASYWLDNFYYEDVAPLELQNHVFVFTSHNENQCWRHPHDVMLMLTEHSHFIFEVNDDKV